MMAYRSSIHNVTKNSPASVCGTGFPLSLPIDCMYSSPEIAIYATSNDYVCTMKQKLQEMHQLMQELMDVEQESQTYYDSNRYEPSYKAGEEVFVCNGKKGETQKFCSFCRGLYTIVEIMNVLNSKVEDKKSKKAIKVHYDRLKKYKTREKFFTSEPEVKLKTTIKGDKINLNKSDDDDIIEMDSSTDSETDLNYVIQSEVEISNNSLNVTNDTFESEANESEQETSKEQEKATEVAEEGSETSSKTKKYAGKKAAERKNPNKKKGRRKY